MYALSSDILELWKQGVPQICNIVLTPTSGPSITINEDSIVKGSLEIDRTSVSGQTLTLGEVIASELSFELFNDGSYDDVVFEGGELYVQIGVIRPTDGERLYMPIGFYTIDDVPRKLQTIKISAFDRMAHFQKRITLTTVRSWFPATISQLLTNVCAACNITLAASYTGLPNASYQILECPDLQNATYRQMISWICTITGTCAYVDELGHLVLDWYHSSNDIVITNADRFDSDLLENSVTITGVKIASDEDEEITWISGTEDYCLVIEDNPLIVSNQQTIADNIFAAVARTYYPMEAETVPLPHLYPMDSVGYKVGDDTYSCKLTNWTFKLNGKTSLTSVGKSATTSGYAKQNALTTTEQAIIKRLTATINETLNARIQEVLNLNSLVANSMGFFWRTEVDSATGATIAYIQDQPTNPQKIFRISGNVFSWSTDGGSTWTSGVDYEGNAWWEKVSAKGLDLADENNNWQSKFTPSAWYMMMGMMYGFKIEVVNGEVQMKIPKLVVDNPGTTEIDGYLEDGKIRITPFNVGGQCVGTGIIQLDD